MIMMLDVDLELYIMKTYLYTNKKAEGLMAQLTKSQLN